MTITIRSAPSAVFNPHTQADPNQTTPAVAALAGGYFPYSTGQVIMVEGGMTLPRL